MSHRDSDSDSVSPTDTVDTSESVPPVDTVDTSDLPPESPYFHDVYACIGPDKDHVTCSFVSDHSSVADGRQLLRPLWGQESGRYVTAFINENEGTELDSSISMRSSDDGSVWGDYENLTFDDFGDEDQPGLFDPSLFEKSDETLMHAALDNSFVLNPAASRRVYVFTSDEEDPYHFGSPSLVFENTSGRPYTDPEIMVVATKPFLYLSNGAKYRRHFF